MKTLTVLLLFSLVIAASCKDQKAEAKAATTKISMPANVEVYNPYAGKDLANPLQRNTPLKLYTLIDVSCSTCLLRLEKWDAFEAELNAVKPVSVIPVCYSKDGFEMIKYLFESEKIPKIKLPLVLDLDNSFRQQNASLVNQLGEMTALTDRDNNVLLTGNPIEIKDDKDKFLKAIAAAK